MNKLAKFTCLLATGMILCTGATSLQAQAQDQQQPRQRGNRGNGNFDPAQMRERMMANIRERLDVKNDEEWKVIQERLEKVMTARRESGGMGFGGRMGGMRPPGGGGGDNNDRRAAFAEQNPEADALQKAIDGKASNDEIKAKLAKYRDSRKTKEANLEKAQDELRQVVSVRQEAELVLMGMLR